MFFLMECQHFPAKDSERDRLRAQHRDWVASGGEGLCSVLIGSALWADDGSALGHWGILEAETPQAARSFAEGDPFAREGVVSAIDITRLADGFKADRISPRMTT
ncbi:YciI family protein [Pararhodobacter zhoushanensis]|uniref:YciI family protein n=1 Tax=Pararhodobacter zhoushanensis TaxID=2479545 RepID=A0ABT3GZA0_9RHOB|nr:YciI family protein [Pararhodobacter zhoushanensis]MCW1932852.1 YciI family protein [Pararhodobacter zhoushanensis]